MSSTRDRRRSTGRPTASGGGEAVYGLGLIGAVVAYWQLADGFGGHLVGLLKALVWPAFLVFEAVKALS